MCVLDGACGLKQIYFFEADASPVVLLSVSTLAGLTFTGIVLR